MFDSNDQSLAPGMLVATPQLDGGPFERAVIVLVHHKNQEGTIGYVVNKPLEVEFGTIMENVDQQLVSQMDRDLKGRTVMFGGPVQMQQLWVLFQQHRDETFEDFTDPDDIDRMFEEPGEQESFPFHSEWSLTASSELIESLALDGGQRHLMPMLGYTGWGEGQLEGEIEEGSWLTLDFDGSFLRDRPHELMWEEAFESLGLSSNQFFMMGQGGSA